MKHRKLRIAWSVAWGIVGTSMFAFGTYLFWPVAKPEDSSERQMRYLLTRDLLARQLQNLNIEIKRKLDEYLDIERESPPQRPRDFQQFNTTQLVHELSRVESALKIEKDRDAENDNSDSMRIQKLRDQQNKMMTELKSRITGGADITSRHRDLQQLQRLAHDMAVDLEKLDAEAASPPNNPPSAH